MSEIAIHVNKQLESIGFPALDLTDETIINSIFSLLQLVQKLQTQNSDLSDQVSWLGQDNKIMTDKLSKLDSKISALSRSYNQLSLKYDQANSLLLDTDAKYTAAKSKLVRLESDFACSKSQFLHQSRKNRQEMDKLRDSLAKCLSDRTTSSIKFALANPLPLVQTRLPKLSSEEKDRDQMTRLILQDYENRELVLMSENNLLRDLLIQVHATLDQSERILVKDQSLPDFKPQHFALPVEMISQRLQESISSKLLSLQTLTGTTPTDANLLQENAALKQKLGEQQHVIDDQNKLIETTLNQRLAKTALDEKLQDRIKQVEEERLKLEKDRRDFTQAAIRMGMERANLDRQMTELELSKKKEPAPATPAWLKPKPFEVLVESDTLQISTPGNKFASFDTPDENEDPNSFKIGIKTPAEKVASSKKSLQRNVLNFSTSTPN